jgi:hypothetical protein
MNLQNIRKQISKFIEMFLYFAEDHKKREVEEMSSTNNNNQYVEGDIEEESEDFDIDYEVGDIEDEGEDDTNNNDNDERGQ